jgi:hypothetical protein
MVILPKAISMFNAIPMIFFTDRKINPKINMESEKTLKSQSNSEQKVQRWMEASQYPTSNKQHAISIKTHEDQWIRIEDLDINSCSYSQLILCLGLLF